MQLNVRHDYDADPDQVFAMLTDRGFLRAKLLARGDRAVEVLECGPGPDGFRIVTRRLVALEVPGFASRFLPSVNPITQTDVWSEPDRAGTRTGTWRVSATGVPVTLSGTMVLAGGRGRATELIAGTVSSSVPVAGGRLAALVGRTVTENLTAEHAFARRWLVTRGGSPVA